MAARFDLLAPHYDIFSNVSPMKLKENIKLPSVTVININAWLASEEMVIS